MGGWMDEWMNGCVGEWRWWVVEWVGGWDGWINSSLYYICKRVFSGVCTYNYVCVHACMYYVFVGCVYNMSMVWSLPYTFQTLIILHPHMYTNYYIMYNNSVSVFTDVP